VGDGARLAESGAAGVTGPVARRGGLSPDRWQRVQDVLAAAIECDVTDRGRLLADRCAGDPELRREVETLLAAHESSGLVDRLADALAPAASWVRARAIGWEGRRVAQYSVLGLLGAGGMGLVYKARDERLGRHVALKFLTPYLSTQPAAKQRFLVEARAAAALDHPNICTIHEIGETVDGQLFIAMPVYDGETLQARLQRGRLSFAEAAPIALQVARGLGRAHERGIVHRDLKPSNVMLLSDGTVKILDFGIATMDGLSLTGDGVPVGTLAYMSPEHVRGSAVDHRGDIWSLGILLHEMLAGTRPFAGDDRHDVASSILTQDPDLCATSHPDVPAALDDVLRTALAKLPEDRYASMAPLAADLAALASAGDGPPGAGTGGRSEPAMLGHQREALPPSERRRAAVLVTTVSDYGALVEHLAPVDAQRLVAQIRDMAVEVVRRHGGLVNQAIGEEIVSLFGVPAAHEDDELRAVRAASELRARVRELTAGWSTAVRIQSGIHAGPVVAQRLHEGPRRYAIVGAPGQVAPRLAALAAPDGVVVSPECQRLVAPFFLTAACSPAVLEPGAQPVTPFRVTGETGLETRLEASERSGLTPYVGRHAELALLERHVFDARTGEGRVVTVVGEAGAGKSRLLYELRERVAGLDGVRLLHGRCRAYGDVAPYSPFIEIMRDALDLRTLAVGDSRDIVARLRAIDAALEPFLPLYLHLMSVPSESHPFPRHLEGEHLQAALLDALAALIAALAGGVTLVVLFEDWHWADTASRAALGRMVEIVGAHPLLFVVVTRPERGGADTWTAHGTRVQLEPLDFAASAAIMRAVLHVQRVSGDLARRVFERTGGNPFFLEQMCCALLEQGAVATRDGEAVVGGGPGALSLPDTVQAVIRARLDNLEPHAREVLRVAAVIGREFEHSLLAAVLGPDVDLVRAIARLKASGLMQQTGAVPEIGYRFEHVLTQEVSYESLLEHQRKSLHDAIGRAIETSRAEHVDEKAALLAYHFGRAGAWPAAVCYGRQAADRASALSQFADAVATLDQVLDWLAHLPDDEGRRDLMSDVLLQQERACETMGLRRRQHEIIGTLIAHLAPRGPSARLALTYLREGDLLTLLKRFDAADRSLSTALRLSRERGDAALERNTLRSIGLLRWHEKRYAEALAITETALSIDRECHDELAVAGDLSNIGIILKSMGECAAALPRIEEALAMPSLAQDPRKLVYALHTLANVHRAMGNPEPALACLRRADQIARTHLLPIQRSFHLTSIAHIDLQQGRIDSALRTYQEAIQLSRRARHAEGLAQSLRTFGDVLVGLGKGDEALPHLREAAQLFAQLEDRETEADIWSRAATILERMHRAKEAADAWGRVRALRQHLGDAKGQLDALEGTARAIRQLKEPPDVVIAAFEAALDLASALGERPRALALRNALGILEWTRGSYTAALTHYEAALLLVRAQSDRAQEGLILNSLGVTLTQLRRPEEARTALEASVALNRETGARLLEAHALAALGHVSRAVARLDSAVRYFEQSLALRCALGDRTGEGWMRRRIAETRAALGDDAGAQRAAAAAARIAAETGDADLIAACGTHPPSPR
jgi:tetratricopeptide (TPR) repeat protein/class 3 adenylate cyclase/tRNA A-37 threonylcarbamoyl transferase component Bud32